MTPMKKISFPLNEIDCIKHNLEDNGEVWTVRVSKEYNQYFEGEILGSTFGQLAVVNVCKISNGLEELKEKYLYFDELTEEILKELKPYKKMDVICLRKS